MIEEKQSSPLLATKSRQLQDAEVFIKKLNRDLTHLVDEYGEDNKTAPPMDPDDLKMEKLRKEIDGYSKNIESYDAALALEAKNNKN